MSELGETFRALREESKERRNNNRENAMNIMQDLEIEHLIYSDDHLCLGEYDYWPSTGLFIHRKTKKRGRGIMNLIKLVKPNEKAGQ